MLRSEFSHYCIEICLFVGYKSFDTAKFYFYYIPILFSALFERPKLRTVRALHA